MNDKIILGLAEQASGNSRQAQRSRGRRSQTYDYVQIPLNLTVNYHAERSDSLPAFEGFAATQREELNKRLQPLQKQLKVNAVPHQHHLVDISVALVLTTLYSTRWQAICCQRDYCKATLDEHHCRCS